MQQLARRVWKSKHPVARQVRKVYWGFRLFSLPLPHAVARLLLIVFLAFRSVFWFVRRVFLAEPLLKGYCRSYGRGLRADIHVPWINGHGDLILGDNVHIDGKLNVAFAMRLSDRPTLEIGDGCAISHMCEFTVAKRITLGKNCMLGSHIWVFDSPGHPADPEARQAGLPPASDDVRPVAIGDNVWIGRRCVIYPGVTIGEGSIVSAGSVVMSNVAPYTIVAGNPARKIGSVPTPATNGKVVSAAL